MKAVKIYRDPSQFDVWVIALRAGGVYPASWPIPRAQESRGYSFAEALADYRHTRRQRWRVEACPAP